MSDSVTGAGGERVEPPECVYSETPNPARMYDYLIGGYDNFEADRQAARRLMEVNPEAPRVMRANRAFLRRAVGFMAEQGIEQFLDIGSGVPTAGNVHEVAQRMTPDARVVCVDSEPVAVRHGEALLEDSLLVIIIHPELVRDVERVLEADGLRGMDLELEVTESAVMEDAELLCGRLDELRSLGVALTIDDFGTGYSSLAYLKKLPVDSLKIDRTFVGGIEHDRKNRLIVAATISLAQSLGLSVVAEGVENAGQHECLRELGCDMAQGYYLGRPLPLEAVSAPNV